MYGPSKIGSLEIEQHENKVCRDIKLGNKRTAVTGWLALIGAMYAQLLGAD